MAAADTRRIGMAIDARRILSGAQQTYAHYPVSPVCNSRHLSLTFIDDILSSAGQTLPVAYGFTLADAPSAFETRHARALAHQPQND